MLKSLFALLFCFYAAQATPENTLSLDLTCGQIADAIFLSPGTKEQMLNGKATTREDAKQFCAVACNQKFQKEFKKQKPFWKILHDVFVRGDYQPTGKCTIKTGEDIKLYPTLDKELMVINSRIAREQSLRRNNKMDLKDAELDDLIAKKNELEVLKKRTQLQIEESKDQSPGKCNCYSVIR